MFQDCVLFNNSIFYNIAYGNVHASREAVIAAAKSDFISLLSTCCTLYTLPVRMNLATSTNQNRRHP